MIIKKAFDTFRRMAKRHEEKHGSGGRKVTFALHSHGKKLMSAGYDTRNADLFKEVGSAYNKTKGAAKAAGKAAGEYGRGIKHDAKRVGKAVAKTTRGLAKDIAANKAVPYSHPKGFVPLSQKAPKHTYESSAHKSEAHAPAGPRATSATIHRSASPSTSSSKKESFMSKGELGATVGVAAGALGAGYLAHKAYKAYKKNKAESEAYHRQKQTAQ